MSKTYLENKKVEVKTKEREFIYGFFWPVSKAFRYGPNVTKGSHSFTCHPHMNHICLYSPAARHHILINFQQSPYTCTGWPKNGTVYYHNIISVVVILIIANLPGRLSQCCCFHQKPTVPPACRIPHLHELQNIPYPDSIPILSCQPA